MLEVIIGGLGILAGGGIGGMLVMLWTAGRLTTQVMDLQERNEYLTDLVIADRKVQQGPGMAPVYGPLMQRVRDFPRADLPVDEEINRLITDGVEPAVLTIPDAEEFSVDIGYEERFN